MAISYPLTLPSTKFRTFAMSAASINAVTRSPFTLKGQYQAYDGDGWAVEVSLPPMNGETDAATVKAWIAFLTALDGQKGTFLIGDPILKAPAGVATGTPLVKGAGQTGSSLITDGWTPTTTGILKAGDFFAIDNRLYMVLQDVNSNGSGEATLDIFPRLRESPGDNAALTINSPKGLFRLANNSITWATDQTRVYNISFQAIEAI